MAEYKPRVFEAVSGEPVNLMGLTGSCATCQCATCYSGECPCMCNANYPCMAPTTKCLDYKP